RSSMRSPRATSRRPSWSRTPTGAERSSDSTRFWQRESRAARPENSEDASPVSQNVETQPAPRISSLSLREALAGRWFRLGIAGMALAAAAFFLAHLTAWPPHEDETLALFTGRNSLLGTIRHVTRDRGGAPLHFILAWGVAHAGFGLKTLR